MTCWNPHQLQKAWEPVTYRNNIIDMKSGLSSLLPDSIMNNKKYQKLINSNKLKEKIDNFQRLKLLMDLRNCNLKDIAALDKIMELFVRIEYEYQILMPMIEGKLNNPPPQANSLPQIMANLRRNAAVTTLKYAVETQHMVYEQKIDKIFENIDRDLMSHPNNKLQQKPDLSKLIDPSICRSMERTEKIIRETQSSNLLK